MVSDQISERFATLLIGHWRIERHRTIGLSGADHLDGLLLGDAKEYGDFSATNRNLIDRALDGRRPNLVEPILPTGDCAFLTKVRHSAFYATPLECVLQREQVGAVILTGQVTEQCVLYSALDAYVRHLAIKVLRDCVAYINH